MQHTMTGQKAQETNGKKETRCKSQDLEKLPFLNASNFHFLTIKIAFLLKVASSEGKRAGEEKGDC